MVFNIHLSQGSSNWTSVIVLAVPELGDVHTPGEISNMFSTYETYAITFVNDILRSEAFYVMKFCSVMYVNTDRTSDVVDSGNSKIDLNFEL